jgi:D-alanyl-lipoteichoic acid acyltransferase DltB (MBOAT superfamily)
MLFDSFDFAIFLPLVFFGYWFIVNKHLKTQNLFILIASYTFYGWWDVRFLALIAFSTLIDFLVGRALEKSVVDRKRKMLLWLSIAVNLGLLGYFKYSNFFIESFTDAFSFFGRPIEWSGIGIVLPVGISFYTFQTLSYTIDVYRRKIQPTKDIIAFSAFVSFFPQLVAGPIERSTHLLPQFFKKREFDASRAIDGLRQILWGLFKKMVIADNCALFVNEVFGNYTEQSGSTLLLAAIFFFFQVYGDFSGYSDIAIGTGRLFGFNLSQNFAFPFFATSINKFWQRWHISLTTWCRDYIYIPLGGNRGSRLFQFRNTLITFSIMGLWHGAQWTYVVWGVLNAIYFIPSFLKKGNDHEYLASRKMIPSFQEVMGMLSVFLAISISLVFFRADDMHHALSYFGRLFSLSFFDIPVFAPTEVIVLVVGMLLVEWVQRFKQHALQFDTGRVSTIVRWGAYLLIAFLINWYGYIPQDFIYFQF